MDQNVRLFFHLKTSVLMVIPYQFLYCLIMNSSKVNNQLLKNEMYIFSLVEQLPHEMLEGFSAYDKIC